MNYFLDTKSRCILLYILLLNLLAFYYSANALAVPVITSVTPTTARQDILQDFTVTGVGLTAGMGFTIQNCEPSNQEIGTGTATTRTFRCTPRLPATNHVTVKTVPSGTTLFSSSTATPVNAKPIIVNYPSRLGNANAHGIPSVDAVSLWNGNVHLEETDLSVAGKGLSFALTRSYNSYNWDYEISRGGVSADTPWRFNWDLKLGYTDNTNNSQLWVQREDGAGENFFKSANIWYPMNQGNFDTLKGDSPIAGQTTLLTREGLRYVFQNPDLGGRLISIADHDNNKLTITRNSNNLVSTVTDTTGRIYTFSYDSSNRLIKVSDFSGRYVQYTWDGTSSRLKTVRDVRGGMTTYNYTAYGTVYLLDNIIDPLHSALVPPKNTPVRSFFYEQIYGKLGATRLTDAMGNTWRFSFCAKNSSNICDKPNNALSFETTTTPPLGAKTISRFNTGGQLIEQINSNNKRTLITPVTATGLLSQNYNLTALATKQQTPLGITGKYSTQYAYTSDKLGNLAKTTDALNNPTQQTWQSDTNNNIHRVTQLTTPLSAKHSATYNATGNIASYTPPNLPATKLAYDAAGQIKTITDARTNSISHDYDANGNLTKVTDADGITQYQYDNLGRVTKIINKRNYSTTQVWDAAGNLTKVTDVKNGVTQYSYDANNNLSQVIDPRLNVTKYNYDANNRLSSIVKTVGTQTYTTTYGYDALSRVISVTNANNHKSQSSYDGEGNLLSNTTALSFKTQYLYDDDNRLIQTIDPENQITKVTYDALGQMKTLTRAFGTTAANTTRYDYDADGRMSRSTDARGNATNFSYDAAGRLTSVTDANNKVTKATYDANGNVLTVTDPNNQVTSYSYDKLNRPLTRTDANGQVWQLVYDPEGTVTSRITPNKTTRYSYDELDRLSKVTYSDASTVIYSYDANGNRLSMTDSTGKTSYSYDALNRLSSVTDPQNKTVSYSYDGVDNLKTLTYPDSKSVSYSYDADERLSGLTDWLSKTTSYTLNKRGQVTSALFGNGSRTDNSYDSAGRLLSLINKQANGTVISSHQFTLDGNGNITQASLQVPLEPSLTNLDHSFVYDKANRLTRFKGTAVSHDSAGRISSLSNANYQYNDRDQITAVTGAITASYSYNGDGQLVSKTNAGVVTRFVLDVNQGLPNVLAENNSAGTAQRRYVYGYGLVEQIDSANAAHYYHFDSTGNTLALTNASGVMSDSYGYTPYGETTAKGTTVNPFRYVGQAGIMDEGNGLHFMRARYYRADIKRFMSLDVLTGSINAPQSLNRYAYVMGNPVMGIDPSGLFYEYGSTEYNIGTWIVEHTKGFFESAPMNFLFTDDARSCMRSSGVDKAIGCGSLTLSAIPVGKLAGTSVKSVKITSKSIKSVKNAERIESLANKGEKITNLVTNLKDKKLIFKGNDFILDSKKLDGSIKKVSLDIKDASINRTKNYKLANTKAGYGETANAHKKIEGSDTVWHEQIENGKFNMYLLKEDAHSGYHWGGISQLKQLEKLRQLTK